MSVVINGVVKKSYAAKCGIKTGDLLISINGNEIIDVLDFRFYQNGENLDIRVMRGGKELSFKIEKEEYDELGITFDTYLIDKQHSCHNKCIFCFIDQMPKGLRDTLYFKDDDSRLSFLFGNYITLTNISEHEVDRIIKMHISPVNVSVHTTDPELRVKMMKNRFAGESLKILYRLAEAGISLNCQLVLCPGWNDGDALRRTLNDLTKYESIGCIACVPVGITKFREGLTELKPYDKKSAGEVIDIINEYGDNCFSERGERICYAADEFYIKAERDIPPAEFYGDFLQLENGVGLIALLNKEANEALERLSGPRKQKKVSIATGVAAAPYIKAIVDLCRKKWHNLECEVYPVINNFFGEMITVSGLVTATDIIAQLKGKDLGRELIVPSSMLKEGEDRFLDDITVKQLKKELHTKVVPIENDGYSLVSKLSE